MKRTYFLIMSFVIILIISCKKDDSNDTSTPDSIIGKYENTTNPPFFKYLIFTSDVCYFLDFLDNNFRVKMAFNCLFYENTLYIGSAPTPYSLNGNQLIIFDEIFVRNDNCPDPNEWVKDITPLSEYTINAYEIMDICYHSGNICIPVGTNIYYFNPSLNIIVDSIQLTDSLGVNIGKSKAIASANNKLWVPSSNGLLSIDPSNGQLDGIHQGIPYEIDAIAYDNNYLWGYSWEISKLYKYDISTNTLLNKINLNATESEIGLTYANGYYYLCIYGVIHKCTFDPFQVISAFSIQKTSSLSEIVGITYDGTDFWVTHREMLSSEIKLSKVKLD